MYKIQRSFLIAAIAFGALFMTSAYAQRAGENTNRGKKGDDIVAAPQGSIPFTVGNLVVCRVGDGQAALANTATAIFLDEFNQAGTFIRSVPVPSTVAGSRLTGVGNSTTECEISRSVDARYVIITGYDAAVGSANPGAADSATVPRVIGRVDQGTFFDLSTKTTSFSTGNIRSAVSTDGINFWAIGSNTGTVFTTLGSTGAGTIVTTGLVNSRTVNIFGGQLYTSSGSGTLRMNSVGTGTPTTTGQTTTSLPGMPTATVTLNAFFFADLSTAVAGVDTLYVADDQSTTAGTIRKYSLVAGNWTATGTLDAAAIAQYRGLTGYVSAPGTVTLFSTRGGNELVRVVDNTGYNGTLAATPTSLSTAGANTAYRGVAFAPGRVTAAEVSLSGRILTAEGRGITNARVTISGGSLAEPITIVTGRRGSYTFNELQSGETYVVTVGARRFYFNEASRVYSMNDSVTDADFVASPQN